METSGCPAGWATDLWMTDHSTQPCTVPLAAFYVIFLVFILFKTAILFRTWQFWLKRFKEMKKTKGALAQRHPIVPTLITMIAVEYLLMLALLGSAVASARNGGGTALYAVYASTWGIFTGFHVKKYISLGRRLIPLAKAHYQVDDSTGTNEDSANTSKADVTQQQSAAETRLNILSRLDRPLQVLMSLMVITVCLKLVCGFILAVVFPSDSRWTRVLLGLVGAYAFFLYISLLWHIQRLIDATKICGRGLPGTTGGDKLSRAIRVMRVNQLVWFISGNLTLISHLLAAISVVDPSWIFMFCMMSIETLASFFSFLSTIPRAKRNNLPARETSAGDNKGGGLVSPHNGPSATNSARFNHTTSAGAGSQVKVASVHGDQSIVAAPH